MSNQINIGYILPQETPTDFQRERLLRQRHFNGRPGEEEQRR